MSVFNILIAEDDVIISEYLAEIITDMGHNVCTIVSNFDEAKEFLENNEAPQMALLDIRMHNRDQGIDIAAKMKSKNIPFVFITSFTDKNTIQNAVAQQPLGYIVKPFKKEEVIKAVTNVLSLIEPDFVMIKDGQSTNKIYYNDVLYLKSENVYVEIITAKKTFLSRIQLAELLKEFPQNRFIRVHRSYAINKNKITSFTNGKIFINEMEIPVSKAYADEIKKQL